MKTIGLVSSSNGLGHARRLMHLGITFIAMGFEVILFLSENQLDKLKNEFRNLGSGKKIELVVISNYGLDGPTWANAGGKVKKPSAEIVSKIQKCNLLISDNVIWPIKFNPAFVLFGHFNWVDYWTLMGTENFSNEAVDVFNEECVTFNSIEFSFQFQDFLIEDSKFKAKQMVPIKLLRYPTDKKNTADRKTINEIWIAKGTTGLHRNTTLEKKLFENYQIVLKETFELVESASKPALIIGRPGLGTIRDCLASGTTFLPNHDNLDVELSSNVNNLENLLLCNRNEDSASVNENLVFSTLQNLKLIDLWRTKWTDISECGDAICEKMIKCI